MIYLDHAATTPPDEAVIRAMEAGLRDLWHNPGAAYAASEAPRRALRQCRQAVAAPKRSKSAEARIKKRSRCRSTRAPLST